MPDIPEKWATEAEIPEEFKALRDAGFIVGSDEAGWRPQMAGAVSLAKHKEALDKGMTIKGDLEKQLKVAETKAAKVDELEARVQEFQAKLDATPELEAEVQAHLDKVTGDVDLEGFKFRADKRAIPGLRQLFEDQRSLVAEANAGQKKAMLRLVDQLKTGAVTSTVASLSKKLQLRDSAPAGIAIFIDRYGDVRPVGDAERLEVVFPDPDNNEEILVNPKTLAPYTPLELMDDLISEGSDRFKIGGASMPPMADAWTVLPTPAPRNSSSRSRVPLQNRSLADKLRARGP